MDTGFLLSVFIALIAGVCIGYVACALMVANGSDEEIREELKDWKP